MPGERNANGLYLGYSLLVDNLLVVF